MKKIFILLCLLSVSCAKNDESKSSSDDSNKPFAGNPMGEWKRGCSASGSTSDTASMNIHAEGVELFSSNFFNSDCSGTPIIQSRTLFDLPTGSVEQGTHPINLNLISSKLKINDADMVAIFNQQNQCGISDWQLGVEKEISGHDCGDGPMPSPGDTFYTIYKLDGNKIYLGKSDPGHNGRSEAGRHTVLSDLPFVR